MKRLLLSAVPALCGLALSALSPGAAFADRRVALVIGNSAYQNAVKLPNTLNDASAMAALFKNTGFDVVEPRQDLGVVEFKRAVREFMNTARTADIAVVYYAGHGFEAGGTNYLIPVDAKLASDYDAEDEAVSLDRVILALQPAQRLRLIILDACRDNPFVRNTRRLIATRAVAFGLAKIEPVTTDTLVAYAAKAGSTSSDGKGPNSPFTTALLKYLAEPGLDIRIALGRVRDEVLKITGNQQEPFVYGSLGGTIVSLVAAPEPKKPEPVAINPNLTIEHDYELAERVGTRQGWESFLAQHRAGFYADLARAQLAKLGGGTPPPEPAKPVAGQGEAKEKPAGSEPAHLQRREEEKRAEPERPNEERKAALRKPEAAPGPDLACKRDEERLARLRTSPDREEVAQLARELGCEDLRPQVVRLLESLTPVPNAPAAAAPIPTAPAKPSAIPSQPRQGEKQTVHGGGKRPPADRKPGDAGPMGQDQACKRDEERLARLRASPEREEVVRFAGELACEALRPQVARLLESIGE